MRDYLAYLAAVAFLAGLYAMAARAALEPIASGLARATGGNTSPAFGVIAGMIAFLLLAATQAG